MVRIDDHEAIVVQVVVFGELFSFSSFSFFHRELGVIGNDRYHSPVGTLQVSNGVESVAFEVFHDSALELDAISISIELLFELACDAVVLSL